MSRQSELNSSESSAVTLLQYAIDNIDRVEGDYLIKRLDGERFDVESSFAQILGHIVGRDENPHLFSELRKAAEARFEAINQECDDQARSDRDRFVRKRFGKNLPKSEFEENTEDESSDIVAMYALIIGVLVAIIILTFAT